MNGTRKSKSSNRKTFTGLLKAPGYFVKEVMACRTAESLAHILAKGGRFLAQAKQALVVMPPQEGWDAVVQGDPEQSQFFPADFPKGLIRALSENGRSCIWSQRESSFLAWEAANPETLAKVFPPTTQLKNMWLRDAQWLGLNPAPQEVMLLPLYGTCPAPGVLVLIGPKRAAHWTTRDLKALGTFSRLAGMALEAFDQRRRLEQRIRQSSAVSEIAQNVNTTLDLDILMRLVLLEMTKAMNCQAGDLWLKDEKRQPMVFQTQLGLNTLGSGKLLGTPYSQRAIETGEPILVDMDAPDLDSAELKREGFRAMIVTPLKAKNKVIGIMHLLAKQKIACSRDDLVLLRTLTSQAALAIDNARLFNETKRKAQELLGLYEVAQVISEMSNVSSALGQIVERVAVILNVEKCWFMFYDERTGELKAHRQAIGAVDEQLEALRFMLGAPGVSTAVFRTSHPFYSNEAERENSVQAEFKNIFNLRNIMAVPLRSREQTLGVFLAGNKREGDVFTGNDVRLFRTLASEATVVIQNANLFDKLRRSYFSIVQVISEMVDAREHYTRGHSERVSHYAAMMANHLKLPAEMVEAITIAGLLHDIGKIGISEKILLKPGKLDADEFQKIKEHPTIGEHILESVEIPWDILSMVRHHHEFFDGQGYPDGLVGDSIPVGARILSVADAFDVITSERTYKKPSLPMEAFAELNRVSGKQFDPAIVAAFAEVWAQQVPANEVPHIEGSGKYPFPEKSLD
jgi:putative nucleotidyltransferase with HDIG domain